MLVSTPALYTGFRFLGRLIVYSCRTVSFLTAGLRAVYDINVLYFHPAHNTISFIRKVIFAKIKVRGS